MTRQRLTSNGDNVLLLEECRVGRRRYDLCTQFYWYTWSTLWQWFAPLYFLSYLTAISYFSLTNSFLSFFLLSLFSLLTLLLTLLLTALTRHGRHRYKWSGSRFVSRRCPFQHWERRQNRFQKTNLIPLRVRPQTHRQNCQWKWQIATSPKNFRYHWIGAFQEEILAQHPHITARVGIGHRNPRFTVFILRMGSSIWHPSSLQLFHKSRRNEPPNHKLH